MVRYKIYGRKAGRMRVLVRKKQVISRCTPKNAMVYATSGNLNSDRALSPV